MEGRNRRSSCPVSIALEVFGDRWSLLVVRDLMVRGFRTFKEFLGSGEGIASNILADRLQKLERDGIIVYEPEESDGRRVNYRLTEKGKKQLVVEESQWKQMAEAVASVMWPTAEES